uniref:ODAD1 central coiled coil region domain-containing protein n=1 Tax=Guillardia theta TaxID=55529 RepID=A0A7S4P372_GUITH|mmetsp:Transcript_42368/g.133497  ORF Transcript_42368/g.133497 Transcript_42368/m.133497 type:complete len:581 (+) Transcript_42368:29-1771(+)
MLTVNISRSLLAKFRQENQELRDKITELSTAGFDEDQNSIGSLALVAKLAEEAETFSAKIEVEKRKIGEHDKKLKDCYELIEEKRDFLARTETDTHMRKQVQRLNDNLELVSRKYASEITENKKARSNINELRRERKRFKQIMSRTKARLAIVEKQIQEIIGESQAFLVERAEYASKIEELQHNADTGHREFLSQCRELKQVIRAFDLIEDNLNKGEPSPPYQLGSMTAEQEEDLRRKVVKGKWQLAKEKAMTDLLKEQAQSFEEAFEKLQSATGYAKIEDFVTQFIQYEELNFHRFQYLHSLNMDIEKLEDEIEGLNLEATQTEMQFQGKNDHWKQLRDDAIAKVEKLEEQEREIEEKIDRSQTLLEQLMLASRSICRRVNISDKELHENGIEDNADPITVMISLLGKVESRAVQLLKFTPHLHTHKDSAHRHHFLSESTDNNEHDEKETAAGTMDGAPVHLRPRAPSVRENDAFDDEDEPINSQTLRQKLTGMEDELLRAALENADEYRADAPKDVLKMRNMKGAGPRGGNLANSPGSFKRLTSHPPMPALNVSNITATGSAGTLSLSSTHTSPLSKR